MKNSTIRGNVTFFWHDLFLFVRDNKNKKERYES